MVRANLTQKVNRSNNNLDRKVNFQEWLLKIQNKYYAQHGRVIDACESII